MKKCRFCGAIGKLLIQAPLQKKKANIFICGECVKICSMIILSKIKEEVAAKEVKENGT